MRAGKGFYGAEGSAVTIEPSPQPGQEVLEDHLREASEVLPLLVHILAHETRTFLQLLGALREFVRVGAHWFFDSMPRERTPTM